MKTKFNVLIIGVGRMGAFFDNPKSENILTHAHAFSIHKGFNLIGFVDNDKRQVAKAAKIWNVHSYNSLSEAFSSNLIDIVCVATSTDTHQKLLEEVLKYPVKLILLEKPIAKTSRQSERIIRLYEKTKVPIVVNYIRRFLPEFEKIMIEINRGSYGNYVAGAGYYGKGLLNNGSHIIDLLHFFFGSVSRFKMIENDDGHSNDEPTVTALLSFPGKRSFVLQGVSDKTFSLFEMDLIFEKQRIRITESGLKIEFQKIQNNKIFKGYQSMTKFFEKETSLRKYMYFVADNIYKHLTKGEEIKCNLLDGYKASTLCFKILGKRQ